MQEPQKTPVQSLDREDPLEMGMAAHSSILAWQIPWTEEPGGLQSMGSQSVRHDWMTKHWATPFRRAPPSGLNHFPKALPPNTITLEVKASTYELGEGETQHSVHNTGRGHRAVWGTGNALISDQDGGYKDAFILWKFMKFDRGFAHFSVSILYLNKNFYSPTHLL